jgi:hypothetical protein
MDTVKSALVEFKSHSATSYGGLFSAGVIAYPNPPRLTYARADLPKLQHACQTVDLSPNQLDFIPKTLIKKTIRRKRESRGGIRNMTRRRGSKPPLPAFTMSNVRSLSNKMDELAAMVKLDSDYRNTSLFCFTETWLTEDIAVCLDGFTFIPLTGHTENRENNRGRSMHGCK